MSARYFWIDEYDVYLAWVDMSRFTVSSTLMVAISVSGNYGRVYAQSLQSRGDLRGQQIIFTSHQRSQFTYPIFHEGRVFAVGAIVNDCLVENDAIYPIKWS